MGSLILNDVDGYDEEILELKPALKKTKDILLHKGEG